MGFANLNTESGVVVLNQYLQDKSYILGYTPSQADVAVFEAVAKLPAASAAHALRWYKHISSIENKSSLPGEKKAASAYGPAEVAAKKVEKKQEEDEDIDLFGSDEEEDAEAEKLKAQRVAEYNARKAAKPKPAAKSMVILDVKPWDDETDMKALTDGVLAIQMDGLVWGANKLVAVGFGIKKLQITCVIEDDKVGVDDLSDQIVELEDYVQSVDVAAFNKL